MPRHWDRRTRFHDTLLVQRLTARIQTGHFHSADELIERALDALDRRTATAPTTATGAVVLAALQARPNTVHLRPLAHARGSVGCCSSEPRTSVSGLSVWWEHLK